MVRTSGPRIAICDPSWLFRGTLSAVFHAIHVSILITHRSFNIVIEYCFKLILFSTAKTLYLLTAIFFYLTFTDKMFTFILSLIAQALINNIDKNILNDQSNHWSERSILCLFTGKCSIFCSFFPWYVGLHLRTGVKYFQGRCLYVTLVDKLCR